jgi:hypothetical protein
MVTPRVCRCGLSATRDARRFGEATVWSSSHQLGPGCGANSTDVAGCCEFGRAGPRSSERTADPPMQRRKWHSCPTRRCRRRPKSNTISHNTVTANTGDGILVDAGSINTLIRGNFVVRNTDDGIDIDSPGADGDRQRRRPQRRPRYRCGDRGARRRCKRSEPQLKPAAVRERFPLMTP